MLYYVLVDKTNPFLYTFCSLNTNRALSRRKAKRNLHQVSFCIYDYVLLTAIKSFFFFEWAVLVRWSSTNTIIVECHSYFIFPENSAEFPVWCTAILNSAIRPKYCHTVNRKSNLSQVNNMKFFPELNCLFPQRPISSSASDNHLQEYNSPMSNIWITSPSLQDTENQLNLWN